MNSIAGSIAAAVEQQLATTNEVARIIGESNKGVNSITETIGIVSDSAEKSKVRATETLSASKELNDLSDTLKDILDQAA